MPVTAIVTNISRCSLHDGPGVRTVVYLKGCGLRCRWCHNPETLSASHQVVYAAQKCIHCGRCVAICPEHHVVLEDQQMHFLRDGCRLCGKCVELCPTGALQRIGEEKTTEDVFQEILKDVHYYRNSGGGVTFSGGECLLHPDFVAESANLCKEAGIHTAVETALFVPWENIEKVLPCTDLFFTDLKHPDPEQHQYYTGQTNTRILENMRLLSNRAKSMIVRIPVIPGVNDAAEHLTGFAEILKTLGSAVQYVELLKYNHLAQAKYELVETPYTKFADDSQSDQQMDALCQTLSSLSGLPCKF